MFDFIEQADLQFSLKGFRMQFPKGNIKSYKYTHNNPNSANDDVEFWTVIIYTEMRNQELLERVSLRRIHFEGKDKSMEGNV